MKIFVDTANIDEIREAMTWGIVDGVTTNPSLIKKAMEDMNKKGKTVNMEDYIKDICKTVGPGKSVSLEVTGIAYRDMVREAEILFKKFNAVAGNVAIKIPVNTFDGRTQMQNYDGLKTISELSKKGIPVNATLIFTPEQALLAAKAGAAYTSPFAGRIDDMLRSRTGMPFKKDDYFPENGTEKDGKILDDCGIVSGVDLIKKIAEIYECYKIKTEIIAASLRNERQVREVALAGADISTIPFGVIEKMTKHPKTQEGVISFLNDTIDEYREIFH